MFIDALIDFYERNPERVLPAYHTERDTNYLLELDSDGGLKENGIVEQEIPVVAPDSSRTSNTLAHLVFDKASYVLGIYHDEEKGQERLKRYRKRVREAAGDIQDEHLDALLSFLEDEEAVESASNEAQEKGVKKGSWIAPLVDGEWLVAKQSDTKLSSLKRALQEKWLRTMSAKYLVSEGECLVCGESKPLLRLHGTVSGFGNPGKSLANMNKEAFRSHGLEQTTNAPMCLGCASKYVQALEYLSTNERHQFVTRIVRNDSGGIEELSKWVAWLREDTSDFAFFDVTKPEPTDALNALKSIWRSRPQKVEANRFHAASLTMSDNRISLRRFQTRDLDEVIEKTEEYFERQKLLRYGEEQTCSLFSLLEAAAPLVEDQNTGRREPDREKLPPRFADALVEHILTGHALPNALRDRALRRCRTELATEAEGSEDRRRIDFAVPVHRAALLKLFLCSQDEEIMPEERKPTEKLDREHPDPAYHCGRYLAVADAVYYSASDGSSKNYVSKRYYTSLSTTPASTVGRIISNVQHQLDKLQRTRGGRATNLDRKITQIMGRIGDFPKTLRPNEQALFALGFYHQRDHIMTPSDDNGNSNSENDESENESA
jgi:CRISPR-associated protein Csd1